MPDTKTTDEITRSPVDGSELVRLATPSANWKASLSDITTTLGLTVNTTTIHGGTDQCILFDKAGVVGEDTALKWDYTNNALTIASGVQTASNPALNITQTWDDVTATNVFTAYSLEITGLVNSNKQSMLMDLRADGGTYFAVGKYSIAGNSCMWLFPSGGTTATQNNYTFLNFNNLIYLNSPTAAGGVHLVINNSSGYFGIHTGGGVVSARVDANTAFGWSSGASDSGTTDVSLFRDAADILAQRRSTNPQTFRVYNTYTNASNYERFVIDWAQVANTALVGTEKNGSGAARNIQFEVGGTVMAQIGTISSGAGGIAGYLSTIQAAFYAPTTSNGPNGISSYIMNSNGTNYSQIGNVDSHTWGIGYGTSPGSFTAGANTLIQWTDNGGITFSPVSGTTNLVGGTVTANNPALNITQKWNNAGVDFQAIKLDVDTSGGSYGANSRLFTLYVNGGEVFYMTPGGNLSATFILGHSGVSLDITSSPLTSGYFGWGGFAYITTVDDTNDYMRFSNWAGTGYWDWLLDGGARTLAIGKDTNAYTLRVYNTYTSATNYERGVFDWGTTSNVLTIGTSKGSGGGTGRDINFVVGDFAIAKMDYNIGQITVSGVFDVGSLTAPLAGGANAGICSLQNGGNYGQTNICFANNAGASAGFLCAKTRSTTVNSYSSTTIVQIDDSLGEFTFAGDDGSGDLNTIAAQVKCNVDGTPAANIIPGRISINTASTTGVMTERMRIDSVGKVTIGSTTPGSTLQVTGSFGTSVPVTTTSTAYTVALTDVSVVYNTTGAATTTLPSASSFPGRLLYVTTVTSQAVNSASSNVIPLASTVHGVSILSSVAGKWAMLHSNGTDWQIMASN